MPSSKSRFLILRTVVNKIQDNQWNIGVASLPTQSKEKEQGKDKQIEEIEKVRLDLLISHPVVGH